MALKKLFLIFIYVINLIFNIHTQDYNVRDFGAIGDGITDDTTSIRAAFQAAANSNGGRVIFDSGYIFFTGCLQIYNNIILDVQGTILGSNSSDHYEFPGINSTFFDTMAWQSLIFGSNLTNVTITGGGVIDGQGANWWPCFSNPSLPPCSNKTRPRLIELNVIKDLVIHNVTLQNSPMYNIALNFCDTAHIYDIKIFNPPSCWSTCPPLASHNTDGVNMYVASNILIENSHISTGDDAIAIYSGSDVASENITVRNMTVGTSHGLSIGSLTSGGIRNITFDNIIMNGSHFGVRVKSQRGRGGLVNNITYSNVRIYNANTCIVLTMNYSSIYHPPTFMNVTPQYQDMNIHDIHCENVTYGWNIEGLDDSEINANFSNIQIMSGFKELAHKCIDIYGNCDNSTVLPACPPCMETTLCEDMSSDCTNYLGQCNNPVYHTTLCALCRKTCKLCDSCN